MSVAVPVIDYIDGATRRIYLLTGVDAFHWIEDIYREYVDLRANDETLRIWSPLLEAAGNNPKGGGKYTPRYVTLLDGCRVVPFDENILINVTGEAITDNADVDPDPFDTSTRTQPLKLYITPPAAEIVQDVESLAAIAYMSFGSPAHITVDVIDGHSIASFTGDQNLLGNAQYPVDNFPDAKIIATAKKIHNLEVVRSCTISVSDFSYFTIRATNHVNVQLTIEDAANVTGMRIDNTYLQGTLDGGVDVHGSIIGDINYFNGHIHDSGLGGTITLGGAIESYIANCTRLVDEIVPTINFDNAANHLVLANYTGQINFTNMTDPNANAMVGLNQGAIILNSATCTAGTVTASGIGKVMDENGDCIPPGMWNGMLVMNSLMSNDSLSMSVWTATLADFIAAGNAANALSTASSGGVDLDLMATAVWDKLLATGLTAEETLAFLDKAISEITLPADKDGWVAVVPRVYVGAG